MKHHPITAYVFASLSALASLGVLAAPPEPPMWLQGEVLLGSAGAGDTLKASIAGRPIETRLTLGVDGLTTYQFTIPAASAAQPDGVAGRPGDDLRFVGIGATGFTDRVPWAAGFFWHNIADALARPPKPDLPAGSAKAVVSGDTLTLSCAFAAVATDLLTQSWDYRWIGLGKTVQGERSGAKELARGSIVRGKLTALACENKTLTQQEVLAYPRLLLVVTPIGNAGVRGFSALQDAVRSTAEGRESKL